MCTYIKSNLQALHYRFYVVTPKTHPIPSIFPTISLFTQLTEFWNKNTDEIMATANENNFKLSDTL